MRKWTKYVEYIQTLIYKQLNERKLHYKNTKIKYILQKNSKSNTLIVVFSACTRSGIPARYNYMRTLKNVKCNKLFILDDYGEDKRGGYYLGRYPDFEFEEATIHLLHHMIELNKVKKCYYVGSSKGAYAALNFGIKLGQDSVGGGIIVGAPQYHLGKYLSAIDNETTLKSMIGSEINNEAAINKLDIRLSNIIREHSEDYKKSIYLHYSSREHTYRDHIEDMIVDLKKCGYTVYENVEDYTNHGDVSLYYPKFLLKTLEKIEPDLFEG